MSDFFFFYTLLFILFFSENFMFWTVHVVNICQSVIMKKYDIYKINVFMSMS
jgi:hypothetical protein